MLHTQSTSLTESGESFAITVCERQILKVEFFTNLFRDKQLAPGTVAGYRAAITSAFKHTGLPDVGYDPALIALQGMHQDSQGFSSQGSFPSAHGSHQSPPPPLTSPTG